MKQCMDADNLHRRLKKIIGQVQAIDRMVDEDVPCEDILAQINAAKSALHGCGKVVLEGHIKHCVRDGIEHGDADKTLRRRSSAFRTWAEQEINPLTRPFSVELHERREAVLCCFSLFAGFITYTPICIISPYPLWYRKGSLP